MTNVLHFTTLSPSLWLWRLKVLNSLMNNKIRVWLRGSINGFTPSWYLFVWTQYLEFSSYNNYMTTSKRPNIVIILQKEVVLFSCLSKSKGSSVHEKSSSFGMKDFRSISILPVFCKAFEKVLVRNILLSSYQSGFRSGDCS